MIKEKKELILYSLSIKPCDEEELAKRDFLENTSLYGIRVMLSILENEGKIYYRHDKYHVYNRYKISE